ncbi:palmitoyl-protein thioesterase 1 [Phlebotomus papatasi]|uniref:palmitoyl-protein thioesterase 1 n=1 Tax=Phlebotomus papatasi TaxID=29031 RepID=UPI00248444CF|nr:palmitoyl-protein thioesterase 1 [Phlebotomus papatasi]
MDVLRVILTFLSIFAIFPSNIALSGNGNASQEEIVPVVLWHGMGDSCCFPFSLGSIKKLIEEEVPGISVISLKIGKSLIADYESGFFVHPDKQVKEVCEFISNEPQFDHGYNAIGFSQGGQFLRALAQRCPQPRMKNLISLGGQHQGIFGLPNCPSLSRKTCEYFRKLLNYAAYEKWVQNLLVQATYWHDPLNEDTYRVGSSFLADINNEREINQDYIQNLKFLERFVMVKFLNDTIVQPIESQWFGFYAPGSDQDVLPLRKTRLFKEDRLGLRSVPMDFLECEGNHLQFTKEWFIENIIPYLK